MYTHGIKTRPEQACLDRTTGPEHRWFGTKTGTLNNAYYRRKMNENSLLVKKKGL